mmetsp:Transcript_16179/g.17959  ORF Transcript_16179/g.17959 Transcript_16179/m.17959 type:complete len:404 (-) Transcript_16179:52-1263(-)
MNGTPFIPKKQSTVIQKGGYAGHVCHIAELDEIDIARVVKDKNVMVVGDGLSAEDAVLQLLKLGAAHVHVASRSGEGNCSEMPRWPGDRVTPLWAVLKSVQGTSALVCQEPIWDEETEGYIFNEEKKEVVVPDVSALIFCTGYDISQEFLAPELRMDLEGERSPKRSWKKWVMSENPLTKDIGHVKPWKVVRWSASVVPSLHRVLLMSNPRMMFLGMIGTLWPLLDADVSAWLALAYVCGEVEIPSEEEMQKQQLEEVEAMMEIPELRQRLDEEYREKWWGLEKHWSFEGEDPGGLYTQGIRYQLSQLARDMRLGGYPLDLGTFEKLNDVGEKFLAFAAWWPRTRLKTADPADAPWRTYRDGWNSVCKSLVTGTGSIPLSTHWLEDFGDGVPAQEEEKAESEE